MYNYNYVIFNTSGSLYRIPSRDDYYRICLEELERMEGMNVVSMPLQECSLPIRFCYALHNSLRLAKIINLPFKRIWYPLYFRNRFRDHKPLCFVLFNHNLPIDYLKYLKTKYPTCRIVMMHRDFLRISQQVNPQLPQNPILDLEMTYDEGESLKYNFPHFSEFESKVDVPIEKEFESDVFFAGKAKDRLPALLDSYQKLTKEGLKVYFFLTGVPVEKRIPLPGVEYADRFMTYREMLYHTVNTKCVLELVQGGGQSGYTSRFLESVIYGKKLITNHVYTKNSKYYDPSRIQVVESMNDIDVQFVKEGCGFVDYGYEGDFSPVRFIDRIEEELNHNK